MSKLAFEPKETFKIYPIGYVRRGKHDHEITIKVLKPFRAALKELCHFSHVDVLWWAASHANPEDRSLTQITPPYSPEVMTGVFASRVESRPNPIVLTTCKLLAVDEEKGILRIQDIDAYDESPVVDIKAYFPMSERVKEAHIPSWLADEPEWMPEEGTALEGF